MERLHVAIAVVLTAALLALPDPAHARTTALPTTIPTSTVQFPSGVGTALHELPSGRILYAGRGIGVVEIDADGRDTRRTWATGSTEAVAWHVGTLYAGTSSGTLQRWDSTAGPTWEVQIGAIVHGVELLEDKGFALVASKGPDPLIIVRLSDGQTVQRVDLDGTSIGIDLSPDGLRAAVIGKELVAEGDDTRPHILVYDVDGLDVTLSDWNEPKANTSCRKKTWNAYIRDVEWAPADSPRAGHFAIVGTANWQRPDSGYCDSLTLIDGRPDGITSAVWSQRTCADTLTSVTWSPDGRRIAAGGHHKCAEWRPGAALDWGRDPANRVYGRDRAVLGGDQYRLARTNAMGLHVSYAWSGRKVPVTYLKCRAHGAQDLLWTDRGLHVAHDCATFGSIERRFVPEELRGTVPASRYALLESS